MFPAISLEDAVCIYIAQWETISTYPEFENIRIRFLEKQALNEGRFLSIVALILRQFGEEQFRGKKVSNIIEQIINHFNSLPGNSARYLKFGSTTRLRRTGDEKVVDNFLMHSVYSYLNEISIIIQSDISSYLEESIQVVRIGKSNAGFFLVEILHRDVFNRLKTNNYLLENVKRKSLAMLGDRYDDKFFSLIESFN